MKAIGLSLGAALVATVNGGHWRTFAAHRVSVSYPPGWYATSRPLTPVTSPGQDVDVASSTRWWFAEEPRYVRR